MQRAGSAGLAPAIPLNFDPGLLLEVAENLLEDSGFDSWCGGEGVRLGACRAARSQSACGGVRARVCLLWVVGGVFGRRHTAPVL
jgi:hypothetical protein